MANYNHSNQTTTDIRQDHMDTKDNVIIADCERLLTDLNKIYSKYADKCSQTVAKRGFFNFGKMFGGNSADSVNDHIFLEDLGDCISELAKVFSQVCQNGQGKQKEICSIYADKALKILFVPKPKESKTDYERYLAIGEYYGSAIFTYASIELLNNIHKQMIDRTPRKLMLPKEL